MGKTVLVIARMISAPPAENAALNTDATKLPATIMMKVASITKVLVAHRPTGYQIDR